MKNFFIFLFFWQIGILHAQNWQPFASTPATYNFVVTDSFLPNTSMMPLIEGVKFLTTPLQHPQYGLRVYDYQLQGNTQRWKVKPNNNLLYYQSYFYGPGPGLDFSDQIYPCTNVFEPGRFLLKQAEFSGDTITLSGSSTSLKFSAFAPPGVAYFAGLIDGNLVFLERSDVYFVNVGAAGDSLTDYTAWMYNQNMEEQITHPLHGRQIITLSKNRGLLQFPDMAIIDDCLVSCNRIEFQEPLVEDYLKFDVGDRFLFRIHEPLFPYPSYLTLNEIISKTEETDQFVYVEKVTGLYASYSTYNTFVVPKNVSLRQYPGLFYVPPQTALAMDSIITGPECGAGMEEFTYFKGPIEMQGRNCLTNPYGGQILNALESCDFTRMIVEGVGFLHSYCFMTLSGSPVGPGYVPVFDRKVLVAYQKANGDSYHLIEANWNVTENQSPEISVFPNPAYNQVNLKVESTGLLMTEVSLTDMFGKVIRQENHPSVETLLFSLENIPAGVYFLRIGLSSGRYFNQKIIKGLP